MHYLSNMIDLDKSKYKLNEETMCRWVYDALMSHQYQKQSEGEFLITTQQDLIWIDMLKDNGNTVGVVPQKSFTYPSDRNVSFHLSPSLRCI